MLNTKREQINGLRGWIGLIIIVLIIIIGGVVYTHTRFMTINEYNRDQDKIEQRLQEIQRDVKKLLNQRD